MSAFFKKYYFPLLIGIFLLYSLAVIFKTSYIINNIRYFSLSDDQMTGMKYAYNLIHGFGLVFNAGGAKVEGITNPLWVFYMAFAQLLPISIAKVSVVLQITEVLLMVGSLYFVKKIAGLISNNSNFVMFLSVVLSAFYFPLINWTLVQGTEVGILTFLISWVTFLALKSVQSQQFSLTLFLLLGIGTLVRMDFMVSAIVISAYLIFFDVKNRKKYFLVGIPIVLGFLAAQELLRIWYYHELLPNTYYQKMAGYPLLKRMTRGLYVAALSFSPNMISRSGAIILGLLAFPFVCLYKSKHKYLLLLLGLFLVQELYSVYVGGDVWEYYGGANRFIAFVMPLFFVAFFVTLNAARKAVVIKTTSQKVSGGVILMALVCAVFVLFNRANPDELPLLFLREAPTTLYSNQIRTRQAYRIGLITTPNAKVEVAASGSVPFFLNRYYVDLLGKNDKVIAHEPMHQHANFNSLFADYTSFYPGHMKWDYPYTLRTYRPDIFVEIYQYPGDNNERYLAKDYQKWISSDGFNFYILKGSKNVILTDLKQVP